METGIFSAGEEGVLEEPQAPLTHTLPVTAGDSHTS